MGLLAKTTRPSSSRIAPRRRLFRLLDRAARSPIVWIAGPAGCGKTSLVSSYVEARRLSALWYQLDAGDCDPAAFFYYMGAALRQTVPRQRQPLPLLTPEYSHDVPTFALRYFEGLFDGLGAAPIVVLDNYQDVPKDAPLHGILRTGLAAVPEGARVVVLGRHMPPPAFARFRAHGQMQVVTWEDLRLTHDEARALVRARGERRLTSAAIRRAYDAADGWAAGLIMMLSSAEARGATRRTAGRRSREGIFDYFGSELFDQTDPVTQRFLVETALLPRMTASMARDLTGLDHAGEILTRLSGSHFFTTRDAEDEAVFQYHPLFRDFLLTCGRRRWTPTEAVQLLERAAAILEAQGQVVEAATLMREIEAWDRLARLIVTQAPGMVAQGRCRTVEAWIRELPADAVDGSAWLLYWLGMCLMPQNSMESRRELERAFALFAREGDMTGQLSAWSAIVECLFHGMDETASLDPWIAWLDEHVPPSFQYPSAEVEAIVTVSMAGALAQRQPYHPRVEYWMERAVGVLHSSADVQLRLRAGTVVAQHDVWRGEFDRLARVADEIRLISRLPNASPLSLILWHWCESYAVCSSIEGSVERGLECLEAGLALARRTGVHVFDTMLLAQAAVSSLAADDFARAQAYLTQMEAGPQGNNSRALQHYLAAWVSLNAQDTRAAVIHAQESLRLAVGVGNWTGMALSRLALADALGAAGRMGEAHLEVAQARTQAEASGYAHLRSDCDLVEAHLLLTAGDPGARPAIARAMATVRSRGFLSAYFGAPRCLARLCLEALVAGIEVDYVRLLVRVRRLRLDPPPLHCAAWPWDIRVATLGPFEIARDGTRVEFSGKAPRRTLLFLKTLIACGERGASSGRLADLLWPDAEGDCAQQALDTSLHRLRQLLGNEKAVQLREGWIRLDGRHCWVDAHAFEALLARADEREAAPSEQLSAEQRRDIERALALYEGPFLVEAAEPWLAAYRERLRRRFIRGVERLGESYELEQRYDRAEHWYMKALEAHETAESLYRRLIRCQAAAGRAADALATYERCRQVLRSSLGVEPSVETDALLASLVHGSHDARPATSVH